MAEIQELDLHTNRISDISSLTNLKSVQKLYLQNNQITNISLLAGLTNLQMLEIENNQIRDISCLSYLTVLNYADVRNNYLDLTPESSAMKVITTLINNGVQVKYTPQRGESIFNRLSGMVLPGILILAVAAGVVLGLMKKRNKAA